MFTCTVLTTYKNPQEYIGFALHSNFTTIGPPILIDFNFLIRFYLWIVSLEMLHKCNLIFPFGLQQEFVCLFLIKTGTDGLLYL